LHTTARRIRLTLIVCRGQHDTNVQPHLETIGNTPHKIRVLLVDGHRIVRHALRKLIDSYDGYTVIGEAGDRASALAVAQAEHPDVILMELELGPERVIDFLPDLRAVSNGSRVLIFTGTLDLEIHKQAIRNGAHGIVLKDGVTDVLLKAIRKVHEGELWVDRTTTAKLILDLARAADLKGRDPERTKIATLTKREREVIVLIAQGLKNKEIAERLFLSENTVRHHLTAVFAKLHVADRLSLVVYAARHSLDKPAK
jgi:two-component system, NarL family, nitrate/nitrite response regulator NarL